MHNHIRLPHFRFPFQGPLKLLCVNQGLLLVNVYVYSALERKLLSHICENERERHLFSSIPSSRLPPGVSEVSGDVRESPYRTDTDTPIFTGDHRRVQMEVRMVMLSFYSLWLSTSLGKQRTLES